MQVGGRAFPVERRIDIVSLVRRSVRRVLDSVRLCGKPVLESLLVLPVAAHASGLRIMGWHGRIPIARGVTLQTTGIIGAGRLVGYPGG